MWRSCGQLLRRNLLAANTISSGLLMATGDLIQQRIERHLHPHTPPKQYDWSRTGRMFTIGLLQGAPQHWFYFYLDKWLPGTALLTVGRKIVVDQLIASPFCIILFFSGMGIMEGNTVKECGDELNEKFMTVYVADWCVWPPSQFINFYFIPGNYRVIYVNALTMLYNIFLSYVKHDIPVKGDPKN
ncbi:mpv17-like protein 2 [Arctopsyche grandis]|uniref:mpv17-like protein 2 n=1 Tax=Arctopsyche grandis TaxID=121162 RepID=UPI00406D9CB0